MHGWEKNLISSSSRIRETIQLIDSSGIQFVVVVDDQGRLLGTVTDGDLRRGMLKGLALDQSVNLVMNAKPVTCPYQTPLSEIYKRMSAKKLRHIPLVDENNKVVGIQLSEDFFGFKKLDNSVVLMAGGLGRRLAPLTNDQPKPLLRVGDQPILEIILKNFIDAGFWKFYISVHYKADMIEKYFGDGSKWGVEISYLREKDQMGTAGALSLLTTQPKDPILVMNGDLLTKIDLVSFLKFHGDQKAIATMCVREYDLQVPYGVVKLKNDSILSIDEKPIHKFFVNGGIYLLNPEVLTLIPSDKPMDMPTLFHLLIEKNAKTAAFPIREYWIDIGRHQDFERAQDEFLTIFSTESK